MNPSHEINRLLEQSGALLVRHKKHLVYRLPNGETYTRAKTASDHRAEKNNLVILRHALGIGRESQKPKGERTMQQQQPTPAPPVAIAPPPPAPPKAALKDRIETAIASEEAIQEKLLAEAQAHERKVHMLKALLPFAEDPLTENVLRGILPAVEPPAPPKPVVPPPPNAITERVQVTRQLVLAATQTFDETFTVNDVMALMVNGHQIDPDERGRVRSSIAQAMVTLHERGELTKEQEHFGRRQTIWRKAHLNGNGHSNGVGTRA
jgi:hypothetical protein